MMSDLGKEIDDTVKQNQWFVKNDMYISKINELEKENTLLKFQNKQLSRMVEKSVSPTVVKYLEGMVDVQNDLIMEQKEYTEALKRHNADLIHDIEQRRKVEKDGRG